VVQINIKNDNEKVRETAEDVKKEDTVIHSPESGGHSNKQPASEKHDETAGVRRQKTTKSDLLNKLAEVQESSDKNYDRYVRAQAEMENLKKRFQKEKEDLIKFSNESLIKQILPVMDNLEKALSHAEEGNSIQSLREGLELTLKGLKDTLEKAGLEEIKAIGEPFDPNFHEAVGEKESDGVAAGVVLEEYQRGYRLNERLIRPAMVVVSKSQSRSS
jgi:molecular chaperone GrpE